MNRKLFAFALPLAMMAACGSNAPEETAAVDLSLQDTAFMPLFDGISTQGWHTYNTDTIGTAWKVTDGVLWLDDSLKTDGRIPNGGDIVTNESYDDFHLQLEWKISAGGNSGIMFFVQEDTAYNRPWRTGPEMQILDNAAHPDAKIIKHRAGDLYDLISCSQETVKPAGEWNFAEIIFQKGQLILRLNDVTVVEATVGDDAWKAMVAGSKFKEMPAFGIKTSGRICLQDHENKVWFRNLRIRRL